MYRATSLIDIALALGILALISWLGIGFWQGFRINSELDATARNMVDVVRRAQTNSVSGENFSSWGATFVNPTGSGGDYYTWYSCAPGTTCNSSGECAAETEKDRFPLSSGLAYTAPPDNTTIDLCFDQRTGKVRGSARTITIQSTYNNTLTRTITVSTEGNISSQ